MFLIPAHDGHSGSHFDFRLIYAAIVVEGLPGINSETTKCATTRLLRLLGW